MGRAKNTLKGSEVSSTPIKLRYSVTYASNSLEEHGIIYVSGSNIPYNVNMSPAEMESMNNYRLVRQLYYQQAITASMGSASFWDPAWQSTAASGTYDYTNYTFPTETTQSVVIFSIPSSQFGEQIGRKSFALSSSQFYILDDGNGNIIDYKNSNAHVGNVFYAQGIVVITNQNYIDEDSYLITEDEYIYETENNFDIILNT